jgi:hypothetical protein
MAFEESRMSMLTVSFVYHVEGEQYATRQWLYLLWKHFGETFGKWYQLNEALKKG